MKINDYYYGNNLTDIKPNDKERFQKKVILLRVIILNKLCC